VGDLLEPTPLTATCGDRVLQPGVIDRGVDGGGTGSGVRAAAFSRAPRRSSSRRQTRLHALRPRGATPGRGPRRAWGWRAGSRSLHPAARSAPCRARAGRACSRRRPCRARPRRRRWRRSPRGGSAPPPGPRLGSRPRAARLGALPRPRRAAERAGALLPRALCLQREQRAFEPLAVLPGGMRLRPARADLAQPARAAPRPSPHPRSPPVGSAAPDTGRRRGAPWHAETHPPDRGTKGYRADVMNPRQRRDRPCSSSRRARAALTALLKLGDRGRRPSRPPAAPSTASRSSGSGSATTSSCVRAGQAGFQ
jgi:hypothetical protein